MNESVGYRSGSRVSGITPALAVKELRRLERRGSLTAAAVVEAARPEQAPLHPAFEWDDHKAAEAHRLLQARQLIRAVVVHQDGGRSRRIYVHVRRDEAEGTYEPMEAVVRQEDRFTLAVMELQQRVTSAQEALDELQDLARGEGDEDRLMHISMAVRAMEMFREAVHGLH